MLSAPFRFDEPEHAYYALDTGARVISITQIIDAERERIAASKGQRVERPWLKDEHRDRGTIVHRLTAEFDLGALSVEDCISPHRGYLLGYVKAMAIVRPKWRHVETAALHPIHRFAGRIDRVADAFYKLKAIAEVKSGDAEDEHRIQTALQAILASDELGLPPEAVARFVVYLKANGKYAIEQHRDAGDFAEAFRLIRRYCR